MPMNEFFEVLLLRDQTVLMPKEQNKHRVCEVFSDFIEVGADEEVFPCGILVGWQRTKSESNI